VLIAVGPGSCNDENMELAGTDTTDAMSITGFMPVNSGITPEVESSNELADH